MASLYLYKKVVKISSFCAVEPILHSDSQALTKYLFGWGRFKASSGPFEGTETTPPIIATCLYTPECHSRSGETSKQNTYFLLVYKGGIRKKACHT